MFESASFIVEGNEFGHLCCATLSNTVEHCFHHRHMSHAGQVHAHLPEEQEDEPHGGGGGGRGAGRGGGRGGEAGQDRARPVEGGEQHAVPEVSSVRTQLHYSLLSTPAAPPWRGRCLRGCGASPCG